MKKTECARRDAEVKELECPGQQPSREIRAECLAREVKNQGGPRKDYSPLAHGH